ncbi:hypothetical protein Lfu02_55130 [Longispora fulva]|uniref:Uncharacterized protein n=1 Tax=Longispora fulva TaxID=619741 RepID=A0A8J7GUC3_9ACTN|nr:hypothetical protein [Longispora fulva]MBG6137506.1 hypothetical protein [Longispora fulva]GIG61141.1 hypothetical protein Lfu02_55130 [Longispora fulva]
MNDYLNAENLLMDCPCCGFPEVVTLALGKCDECVNECGTDCERQYGDDFA